MTKHAPRKATTRSSSRAAPAGPGVHADTAHPRSLPVLAIEDDAQLAPDQPFAEGAHDAIDPDLRHRMISETAYRRYIERGYEDGYDMDDWLQAEADVDHLLLSAGTLETRGRRA